MSTTESIDELTTAKRAIVSLLQGSGSVVSDANRWLCSFERTRNAWYVANELILLNSSTESYYKCLRFYGIQIFYRKIKRDFHQLDVTSATSLKESLLQQLLLLASCQDTEHALLRYFCLALSTIAVQLNTGSIVDHMLSMLSPVIKTNPLIIIELLTVLPEECHNTAIDVSSENRRSFTNQLTTSVDKVLQFLHYVTTVSTMGTSSVNKTLILNTLHCLEKWIDYTQMSAEQLLASSIYSYALTCLQHNDYIEAAADVMRTTTLVFGSVNQQLLIATLPHIVNLTDMWNKAMKKLNQEHCNSNLQGDDEDEDVDHHEICRILARLFTDVCTNCIGIFYNDQEAYGQNELLMQLLHMCNFPYDHDVSSIATDFIYCLCSHMHNSNAHDDDEDNCNNSSSNSKISNVACLNSYNMFFKCCIDIAITRMSIPINSSHDFGLDRTEDLDEQRQVWFNVVKDICGIVSIEEVLLLLCTSATSITDYSKIEACLYAVQAVSSFVDDNENMYIPQVMTLIAQLPQHIVPLQETVIYLLGCFARWIAKHNTYLSPVLSKLTSSLADINLCKASSKALLLVLKLCDVEYSSVQEVHACLVRLRTQGIMQQQQLPLLVDLNVLEGIALAISRQPANQHHTALTQVIMPITSTLSELTDVNIPQSIAASHRSNISNDNQHHIVHSIERLCVVVESVKTTGEVLTELFVQLMPLFQRTLSVIKSERIAEKICKCYKVIIPRCDVYFQPYYAAMLSYLIECFQTYRFSCFLYACSKCVRLCKVSIEAQRTCLASLWIVSDTMFTLHPTIEAFKQNPCVVEEYFYLFSSAINYCNNIMLDEANIQRTVKVVEVAVSCLDIEHKDVQLSVLFFFQRLLDVPYCSRVISQTSSVALQLIQQSIPSLVIYCTLALAGSKQLQHATKDIIKILYSITFIIHKQQQQLSAYCSIGNVCQLVQETTKNHLPVWVQVCYIISMLLN